MEHQPTIPHRCITMDAVLADGSAPIVYIAKFREFAVECSPNPTMYVLRWCPWCGDELPLSLREEFFDEILALDLEIEDESLPERYSSDSWWRDRN